MTSNRNVAGIVVENSMSIIEQFLNALTPELVRGLLTSPPETPVPGLPNITFGQIYAAYSASTTRRGITNFMDEAITAHNRFNDLVAPALNGIEQAATAEVGPNILESISPNARTVIEDQILQTAIDGIRGQFGALRDMERSLQIAERAAQVARHCSIGRALEFGASAVLTGITSQQVRSLVGNQPNSSVVNRAIAGLQARGVSLELGQLSELAGSLFRMNPVQTLANASRFGFTLFGVGGTEYAARRYVSPILAPLEQRVIDALRTQPERTIAEAVVLLAGVYVSASLISPTAGVALAAAIDWEIRRAASSEITHHLTAIGESLVQRMFGRRPAPAANAADQAPSEEMNQHRSART